MDAFECEFCIVSLVLTTTNDGIFQGLLAAAITWVIFHYDNLPLVTHIEHGTCTGRRTEMRP